LEVDSASLEVRPTAPLTVEEEETNARRRRVAMGVSISFLIVGVVIGAAVGVSVSQIKRRELLGSSGGGIAF